MTRKNRIVTFGSAVVIAATGPIAIAGDLNPPLGPVAPTMKTLTDVEPRIAINATNTPGDADSLFKITQPGSYYLTGNITGVAAKHGIEITANGVTLDLNGFDLVGIAGSLDGVSTTVSGLTNIAVVNGSVRTWGGDGVDLGTSVARNCRVEDVLANANTGRGINTGFGCSLTNCSASTNNSTGINTRDGCTVNNCSAYQNTGNGINVDTGCMVSNCSASLNTGQGITTVSACAVSNCSAYSNGDSGIGAGSYGTVLNCSAYDNGGNGINASFATTITDCSASGNTLNGISILGGGTVTNCPVYRNSGDGIVCSNQCVIRGNTCTLNGDAAGDGAGIHVISVDNRIEGNTCTGADRGIDVDFSGNIIIKNTCSGNTTNWDIVIGNAVAPIVAATTNATAILGNTYVGSLGNTDPNANFTY